MAEVQAKILILPIFENSEINAYTAKLNANCNNLLTTAMGSSNNFKGQKGQFLDVYLPSEINGVERIILLGMGMRTDFDLARARDIGGKLALQCNNNKIEKAAVIIENLELENISDSEVAINIAFGAKLRNYGFYKYYAIKQEEHQLYLKSLSFGLAHDATNVQDTFLSRFEKIADAVHLSRNLTSEPPNVLTPKAFADIALELQQYGVKVTILSESEMKSLGMHALLGVAQGSINAPYIAIMEWKGNTNNNEFSTAFVGKGVTFDTGGINLKPTSGISDMKTDMTGAAVVTSLIKALATRKAKVNVIGAIGLVENMPSGSAQRPSDVVRTMSGQTVEVDNTDAEGRLVLADVLWYVQTQYRPNIVIDLATLTGAISVALGDITAGLFSNSDTLALQLSKASEKSGEKIWRLPMGKEYDKQIDSDIADIKNVGSGRGAGSITAAQFLKRFIHDNVAWAHLDIAGVSWVKNSSDLSPKGATGFGVRLLEQFIWDYVEKN
jgi:leucyl aminopeptidase